MLTKKVSIEITNNITYTKKITTSIFSSLLKNLDSNAVYKLHQSLNTGVFIIYSFLCYSVDKPNLAVDRTHESDIFFIVCPGKSSLPVPFFFPVLHLYTYHGSLVSNTVENI